DGHARVSKVFALAEERAFAHVECANFLVRRIDSMNAIARATGAKCDQALLVDFRRNTGEHGTLGTNKVEIIAREPHLHAGFCPPAWIEVRPGKIATRLPPKVRKAIIRAFWKPEP